MQSIPVAVDKNQSDSGPVSVNPHLPLTVSVDGEFSPVNALADSQMLKCRPEGVSNIVHNYDRCSVTVIQSYVSTFAMSEREQLQILCVNVEDCKAQSGAIPYKAVSEIVCSSELHSCDIFSKPPPDVIFMLSENILKDSEIPDDYPARSLLVSLTPEYASAQSGAIEGRIIDDSLPWDPGEIYEYNKARVAYQGIPRQGIGTQDLKEMKSVEAYVRVLVNGFESLFLLDTGCSGTVISEEFAKFAGLISQDEKPDPSIINKAADGSNIPSYGYRTVELEINDITMSGQMMVSRVCENGFLGMDFLAKVGATIDFDEMFIEIYEQKVPLLTREGKRIVNSLFTRKPVLLPKFSQNVVDLELRRDDTENVGLVEPRNSVLEHYQIVGGRNLGCSSRLKMRILNPLDQDIVIPAGTSVAYYVAESAVRLPGTTNRECCTNKISVQEINDDTPIPDHVQTLYNQLPDGLSEDTKRQVRHTLIQYESAFSRNDDDVGFCDWIEHDIRLIPGTKPIRQPPYRAGYHESIEIEKHVTKLLNSGMIERVISPWSSPVLTVIKKDGKTRFVQDYRKLNACTEQESYPLPRQDDALEALRGSKFFTTADLTSGYYQIPLSAEATKISCFVTKSGTYGFKRLPMGLSTSSHCFERLMETVLRGLQYEELLVYMDDVIVFSSSEQQHVERLSRMLGRLMDAGLKIKPAKTRLFQRQVEYLGHIVDEHGIHTDPKKIEAIMKISTPDDVKPLRSFLGLTGYYRKFIPNYGGITQPLCKLLKKKVDYIWTEECEQAFLILKQALCDNTVLAYPDYSRPFILDTDASYLACGAVLGQLDDNGDERPVSYYSFALNNAQKNYGVTKLEMLALVSAIRHFRCYLYGAKFLCRTDHHSLIWLKSMKHPQGILARWLETLANYDFEVKHRPGQIHANADALSRLPYEMKSDNEHKTCAMTQSSPLPSSTSNSNGDDQEVNVNSCALDQTELIDAQKADPDVNRIREWLSNGIYPPQKELRKYTRTIRYYLGKRDSLRIIDDVLVDVSTPVRRVVIPRSLQDKVITAFHMDDHAGIERTCKRIDTYYLWHLMHGQVRDYVHVCHSCQVHKAGRNKTRYRSLATGSIMDQVSLDIVGSFRPTKNDNTVILVAVEHFSRWAEAYPLPHASAENCAQALYNGIFSRFGFSRIIHMDRAAYFMSDLMDELARLGNSKTTFSCRYHPQGNSMVERVNGTIISSLRTSLESASNREWDEILETVMIAYRATPHPATGVTPNRMMIGREARLSHVFCPQSDPQPVTEYIKQLDNTLYEVYNTQRNVIAEECHFDGIIHTPHSEGDKVLIQRKKSDLNKPGKLESRYYGPFTVVKRLDFDSYIIQEGDKQVIEHHSRLKPYHEKEIAMSVQDDNDEHSISLLPLTDNESYNDQSHNMLSAHDDEPQTQAAQAAAPSPLAAVRDQFVTMGRPNRRRAPPPRFDDYWMGSPE